MKTIFLLLGIALSISTLSNAQISNAKTVSVTIHGNCGMCENTIEKAATKKKISSVDWNQETKVASITFDSTKTSLNKVLKNVALAGYDNDLFMAPDAAYNNLHGCCKYDRKTTAEHTLDHKEDAHSSHQTVGTSSPQLLAEKLATNSTEIEQVFQQYFRLKDALVKGDGELAASLAKELFSRINAVNVKSLPDATSQQWTNVLPLLKEDAAHIGDTKDIAHQRDHFTSLSENLYRIAKVSRLQAPIYYQHCPMANKGKGANWLSQISQIQNPYYGSAMLSCGRTTETIQ